MSPEHNPYRNKKQNAEYLYRWGCATTAILFIYLAFLEQQYIAREYVAQQTDVGTNNAPPAAPTIVEREQLIVTYPTYTPAPVPSLPILTKVPLGGNNHYTAPEIAPHSTIGH